MTTNLATFQRSGTSGCDSADSSAVDVAAIDDSRAYAASLAIRFAF